MSLVSCMLFVCLFCLYIIARPWGFILSLPAPALAGALSVATYLHSLKRKEGWLEAALFFGVEAGGEGIEMSRIYDTL